MAPTAPSIAYRRLSDKSRYLQEVSENRADQFVVSMPLCRGRASLVCDGGTIFDGDVRPGMLRVLSPGERVILTRRTAAEAAILMIAGPWFRRRVEEAEYRVSSRSLLAVEPILHPDHRVERLAHVLSEAPLIDPAQRNLFVEGLALALLAIRFGKSPIAPRATPGLSQAEFERCVAYADAAIAERIDLSRWAAALDMTAGEFARRFRLRAGMAPYAWLLDWRVERARHLLLRNNLPLADVALAVGFSSQSHFTDAFRRRAGLPPGRWRALARAAS